MQLHVVLLNFLLLASSIVKTPNKIVQNSSRQGQAPLSQRWLCGIFPLSSIGSEFNLLTIITIARNIWFLESIPLGSDDPSGMFSAFDCYDEIPNGKYSFLCMKYLIILLCSFPVVVNSKWKNKTQHFMSHVFRGSNTGVCQP